MRVSVLSTARGVPVCCDGSDRRETLPAIIAVAHFASG
jgi:hypothetical protein